VSAPKHELKLLVQEYEIPGGSLEEKWELLQEVGFHGIELHGRDQAFAERLPELQKAAAAGVPMPSVCLISERFIGDWDADVRKLAVANMKTLLSTIAAIGGRGAITPAAFGLFSKALPPFTSPRTVEEDRAVLLEALAELAAHAETEGVDIYLEPLNRYEDHMLHKLHQAVSLIEELGSARVKVLGDTFHMNIEEDDIPASLLKTGRHLGHIHLADSQRSHPGSGHTDFGAIAAALRELEFDGYLAMECGIRGDKKESLRQVAALFN
jgi:sugar phosphate isomerase/epimerase